jgi:hypothetical protein
MNMFDKSCRGDQTSSCDTTVSIPIEELHLPALMSPLQTLLRHVVSTLPSSFPIVLPLIIYQFLPAAPAAS